MRRGAALPPKSPPLSPWKRTHRAERAGKDANLLEQTGERLRRWSKDDEDGGREEEKDEVMGGDAAAIKRRRTRGGGGSR